MMNASKLRDLSDFERPQILIKPVIEVKPYENQDFYDRCLEFRTRYRQINDTIIELEHHVKIVNARCDRMNNLIQLMELSEDSLKHELDEFVRKFVEYYDISNVETKIGELYSSRNSMMNVLRLFTCEPTLCALCLERSNQKFNIPCGHSMCTECEQRTRSIVCPFCRSTVEKSGNLFLD